MKTTFLFLGLGLMCIAVTAQAQTKSLELTVADIRSDKGNILVMARIAGQEQPVYGMTQAKAGQVVVTLEGLDADVAEVSLFHDEDGDHQLKMGDRGPAEGYATKKCKLPEAHNTATLKLYYPSQENR